MIFYTSVYLANCHAIRMDFEASKLNVMPSKLHNPLEGLSGNNYFESGNRYHLETFNNHYFSIVRIKLTCHFLLTKRKRPVTLSKQRTWQARLTHQNYKPTFQQWISNLIRRQLNGRLLVTAGDPFDRKMANNIFSAGLTCCVVRVLSHFSFSHVHDQ